MFYALGSEMEGSTVPELRNIPPYLPSKKVERHAYAIMIRTYLNLPTDPAIAHCFRIFTCRDTRIWAHEMAKVQTATTQLI